MKLSSIPGIACFLILDIFKNISILSLFSSSDLLPDQSDLFPSLTSVVYLRRYYIFLDINAHYTILFSSHYTIISPDCSYYSPIVLPGTVRILAKHILTWSFSDLIMTVQLLCSLSCFISLWFICWSIRVIKAMLS